MSITKTVKEHRKYFLSGKTRDYDFRIDSLKKLRDGIIRNKEKIYEALYKDLHKPKFEGLGTEVGLVLQPLQINSEKIYKDRHATALPAIQKEI